MKKVLTFLMTLLIYKSGLSKLTKSGTNLTFNSSTGALTATSFVDGDGNSLVSATAAADEATALGIALG